MQYLYWTHGKQRGLLPHRQADEATVMQMQLLQAVQRLHGVGHSCSSDGQMMMQ